MPYEQARAVQGRHERAMVPFINTRILAKNQYTPIESACCLRDLIFSLRSNDPDCEWTHARKLYATKVQLPYFPSINGMLGPDSHGITKCWQAASKLLVWFALVNTCNALDIQIEWVSLSLNKWEWHSISVVCFSALSHLFQRGCCVYCGIDTSFRRTFDPLHSCAYFFWPIFWAIMIFHSHFLFPPHTHLFLWQITTRIWTFTTKKTPGRKAWTTQPQWLSSTRS